MKTTPAPIANARPNVLACPAAYKQRLRLTRKHRFSFLLDCAVVPRLTPTIRRLAEERVSHAGHAHSSAA